MGTAWRRPGDHGSASGGASPGLVPVAALAVAVARLACRPSFGTSVDVGFASDAAGSPMTRTCAVAVAGSSSRSGSRARLSRCRNARLRRKGPPDEAGCRSPFFDVDHDDWRFMVSIFAEGSLVVADGGSRFRRPAWPKRSTAAIREVRRRHRVRAPDGPIAVTAPDLTAPSPPTQLGRPHGPSRRLTRS
jgi:hypothetical protein